MQSLTKSTDLSLYQRLLLTLSEGLSDTPNDRDKRKGYTDLTAFKHAVFRGYEHAAHLELLDRHLSDITRYISTDGQAGFNRLIIEMPPRHGKTKSTSQLYPAWHLGIHPDNRVMMVSYGQDLADKNSRAARNLIRSPAYRAVFPHVRLADDSRAANAWDIAGYQGGVDAIGIGGGAAGKGANLLLIDDVIKNRAEAESKTYRDRIWDSFTDDLYTRLEPNGAIVIINTRWQTDDLTARVLERMPNDHWVRLTLPALASDPLNDPLGRAEGEALWSSRYPVERLLEIRDALGEYSWSSLYQQTPIPSGGGTFKTERLFVVDALPTFKRVIRFYDLAITRKTSADYTAGVKMGVTDDEQYIVLDVYRAQKEAPDIQADIVQNAQLDGVGVEIVIEAAKEGSIALDYLMRDPRMAQFTMRKRLPIGDKFTRALPFASRVEAGRVGIVRGSWNRDYLDELAVFPNGGHDDQVDGSSGAYGELASNSIDYDHILTLF